MYNTVCFDLDGTLLNSKKEIDTLSKEVIHQLKSDGVQIIFATGRHFVEIVSYIKECCLTETDYIISCDGQYIYDIAGKIVHKNNLLNRKDLLWISRYIKEFYICTDTGDYRFKGDYIKKGADKNSKKPQISRWNLLFDKNLDGVEKIVINGKIECTSIPERYTLRLFEDGRTEILHNEVNKYQAIKELCDKGLIKSMDELLYFGDDYNDQECFDNIKTCVAMSTAPESIKKKAFFVTKSCDDNGISYAINELIR